MKSQTSLFSTSYLPPITYIRACLKASEIILDSHEHFVKQSYRNRCRIYGANGMLQLIIPVSHDQLFQKPISEVTCIIEEPWQTIHWRSISAAYRNSPYFEYYEEEFKVLFKETGLTLFEFNLKLLRLVFKILKQEIHIGFTESFEKTPQTILDLRHTFHPKKLSTEKLPRYHQVFEDRHGFIPDLSILDLLCNMGPNSSAYLLDT